MARPLPPPHSVAVPLKKDSFFAASLSKTLRYTFRPKQVKAVHRSEIIEDGGKRAADKVHRRIKGQKEKIERNNIVLKRKIVECR